MKKAAFPVIVCLLMSISTISRAQFLMDMIDTTTEVGKGMFSMYKKYDALRIGGYMQPQWQITERQGAKGYAGGDFAEHVNNRFMLRRGRVRFDYERYNHDAYPIVQFALQFDGTERGVNIRDFWGRFFENKYHMFSLTAGMFARPFGYEINLSSSDRETPERGRMSQILMRTERDLGAMISFEPRKRKDIWRKLKIDAGFFNGQGLAGTADFDSHKDLITRVYFRQLDLSKKMKLSIGASMLYGGMQQFTRYINKMDGKAFSVDSSLGNIDKVAPRHYYGADAQLRIANRIGYTELRAEYIRGQQTATALTTETPGSIPMTGAVPAPLYIRQFDGAYFYYVQHLNDLRHQLIIKYDWYDPNKKVKGEEIDAEGRFTGADVRYNTLGLGYLYHFSPQLKMFFYYDWVRNESTDLDGYTEDLHDNVFTCRLQYRF